MRWVTAAGVFAGVFAAAMLQGAPRALAAQQAAPGAKVAPVAGERPMWIEEVRPGLYVIRGPIDFGCMSGCKPGQAGDGVLHEPGVSAARVTPAGVVLVDAKFAQDAPQILALVRSVTAQPVRYLINTHHHPDHTGGDAAVVATGGIELIQQRALKALYRANTPGGGAAAPVTFGDDLAIELGGARVEALHYLPTGHTAGDTFVWFPDLKVVHMGDLVIRGMPHIDYRGGGSAVGFVTAIYQLLKLDFELAIPGHGAPMTRGEVRDYAAKMETLNARMKDAVRRGVPVERAAAELGLEDLGWAHSASTTNFLTNDVPGFYAEMAAVVAAERRLSPEGPRP